MALNQARWPGFKDNFFAKGVPEYPAIAGRAAPEPKRRPDKPNLDSLRQGRNGQAQPQVRLIRQDLSVATPEHEMLKPMDYDHRQHRRYVAGRDLGPKNAQGWASTFTRHVSSRRPLSVLDLGCGSGRFTAALAEAFEGPVYGVESSGRMRHAAEARVNDPRLQFMEGRAEQIPLPDGCCDVSLMFLSFHHVRDRPAAAREIARALRPGGRLLIRSQFADRFPDLAWHACFPRAREIELTMFPSTVEVEAVFATAGLKRVDLVSVEERFADSLTEHAEKLRHRAISTFEHLTERRRQRGLRALRRRSRQT